MILYLKYEEISMMKDKIGSTCIPATYLLVMMLNVNNVIAAGIGEADNEESPGAQGGALSWEASVGLGYDTNIYLAPDSAYTDYFFTPSVGVNPVTRSGFFVPVKLDGIYESPLNANNILSANYKFSGNFYIDRDYSNADVSSHTINIGDRYVFDEKGRLRDSLYGGIILIKKKDEYTERDTGLDKETSALEDISARYNYTGTGVELEYKKRIGKTKYGVKFKRLMRDYEDTVAISQLDHTYTSLSADAKFSISKPSKLQLKYKHSVYDYDERPSRDVNGNAFTSNPPLEYVYNEYIISYLYKFSRDLKTYFDYSFKTRSDEFVGYNDYDRNKYRIRALYDYSKDVALKAALTYWERDYPNAFAFDNDLLEAKSYDGVKLEVAGEYAVMENRTYWLDFEWRDENSTDKRYEYNRMKVMVGVKLSN